MADGIFVYFLPHGWFHIAYHHHGPLRSELKVSKACLAPKAPRGARSARLLESADLRFSTGYEAKLFDKDRKAKVNQAWVGD